MPYGRRIEGVSESVAQEGMQHLDHNEMVQHVQYAHPLTSITCFLFPHAGFVNVLSQLGFNQNDGIINLMPIAAYCDDE
jgi:hypothetical protein